eukprot:1349275-Pyramimonas_sp.AAC.1
MIPATHWASATSRSCSTSKSFTTRWMLALGPRLLPHHHEPVGLHLFRAPSAHGSVLCERAH